MERQNKNISRVTVCDGLSCDVMRSSKILKRFRELNIPADTEACFYLCSQAPVYKIRYGDGEEVYIGRGHGRLATQPPK